MANTITNRQLFFMLLLTLTGGIVSIAKNMAATTMGTNAWRVLITTSLLIGLAAALIVSLTPCTRARCCSTTRRRSSPGRVPTS